MFTVLKTVTMKNVWKTSMFILLLNIVATATSAQNETATIIPKATAIIETPVAAPAGKPMIITLHNASEKSMAVFAGPKEELKEPKVKVVGGLSNNILYLKENDAVCLLTVDKRPAACTIIKAGVSTVEVNVSGNAISSK